MASDIRRGMLLHLLPADPKFVSSIVEVFKNTSFENRFFVVGDSGKVKAARFLEDLIFLEPGASIDSESLNQAVGVICYSLRLDRNEIAMTIPHTIPLGWMLFGCEYHNVFPELRRRLYFSRTKKIAFASSSWKNRLRLLIDRLPRVLNVSLAALDNLIGSQISGRASALHSNRRMMRRAKLIGFPIKEEFDLVVSTFQLSAEFSPFCCAYLTDSEVLGKGSTCVDERNTKPSILLGNSSVASNNHAEIIDFLSHHCGRFERCVVPLSYGNRDYAKKVQQLGSEKLGKQFEPLTDFLPLKEYESKVANCKIAILNHRRQQGLGTAMLLLWQGAKLFLSQDSTVFDYFKRIGVSVFSIEHDLYEGSTGCLTELSEDEIIRNRKILREEFSKNSVMAQAERFAQKLIGGNRNGGAS